MKNLAQEKTNGEKEKNLFPDQEADTETDTIEEGRQPDQEQPGNVMIEKNEKEEMYEVGIDIYTVADYIRALKYRHTETEDEHLQKEIMHQLVTIELGLKKAQCSAYDIKAKDTPENVLGIYDPQTDEEILSINNLLADKRVTPREIAHVAIHEEAHGLGKYDEPIAEHIAEKKFPISVKFYVLEQRLAESIFHKEGIDKIAEIYDIDNPEELADCYLEVELENRFKWKIEKLNKFKSKNFEEAKDLEKELEKEFENQADRLSQKLESSLERLYGKLKDRGYSFRKRSGEILEELTKK